MLEALQRRYLPFAPSSERQAHQYLGYLVVGRCIDDKRSTPGPGWNSSHTHFPLCFRLRQDFPVGNNPIFDVLGKLLGRKHIFSLDEFSLYQA
jgi:hypothetical protein